MLVVRQLFQLISTHSYLCIQTKIAQVTLAPPQDSTLTVVLYGPRQVKKFQNCLGPVKKDVNWSYRASKHLGTFLLTSYPSRMCQMLFEINEDEMNKNNKCCRWILCDVFFILY